MEMFIGAFGAEAGNLALKTLPTGGLYIAGGVAPKNLWALQENHQFVRNCVDKGTLYYSSHHTLN
jgi:glucokinase